MTPINADRLTRRLDLARIALREAAEEMGRHEMPHLQAHASQLRGAASRIDEWIAKGEPTRYE